MARMVEAGDELCHRCGAHARHLPPRRHPGRDRRRHRADPRDGRGRAARRRRRADRHRRHRRRPRPHHQSSSSTPIPGVDRVVPVSSPYKLAHKHRHGDRAHPVEVAGVAFGGPDADFRLILGPCAVESAEQTLTAARACADAGADLLRGGAFKPRTSPYAFQGLGARGPEDPRRRARGDRPADRHRAHRPARHRAPSWSTPTASRSARATCSTSRC